ncbi:FeoA family protein [Bacillus carboniphilus]|uniref:FeoA family protein n=1 Tax=Bacillus carboniphilus TaxID=86663 RepID=A0ABY9JUF5_9BACI|nr:FeoA family protein [Bacillus carboniphilus]WLR43015.1 FeoA family protein [Bacillus carboniphilus]
MYLNQVKRGESVFIDDMSELKPVIEKRLRQLGITIEKEVKVIKALLFRGPITIQVNDFQLAIRYKDVARIGVKKK